MSDRTIHSSLLFVAARDACTFAWPILMQAWPALISLQLAISIFEHFSSLIWISLQQSGREDLTMFVIAAGSEVVFAIVSSALWTLTIAFAVASRTETPNPQSMSFQSNLDSGHRSDACSDSNSSSSSGPGIAGAPIGAGLGLTLRRFLNPVLIESVRALAAVIIRLPLLIVPALVEYVRLCLVPYVVILDPAYERGEKDALQESRSLARGHFALLLTVIAVHGFILFLIDGIWALDSSAAQVASIGAASLPQNLSPLLFSTFLSFVMNLLFGILLFSIAQHLIMIRKPGDRGASTTASSSAPSAHGEVNSC